MYRHVTQKLVKGSWGWEILIFYPKMSVNVISTLNRFFSFFAHFFGKIVNFPNFLGGLGLSGKKAQKSWKSLYFATECNFHWKPRFKNFSWNRCTKKLSPPLKITFGPSKSSLGWFRIILRRPRVYFFEKVIFHDFGLFLHLFFNFSKPYWNAAEAVEGLFRRQNGDFSKKLENSRFFRKNAPNRKKIGWKT